jgi:predicted Zn-dependent protease
MKRAGLWRLNLRQSVLNQLGRLGRDLGQIDPQAMPRRRSIRDESALGAIYANGPAQNIFFGDSELPVSGIETATRELGDLDGKLGEKAGDAEAKDKELSDGDEAQKAEVPGLEEPPDAKGKKSLLSDLEVDRQADWAGEDQADLSPVVGPAGGPVGGFGLALTDSMPALSPDVEYFRAGRIHYRQTRRPTQWLDPLFPPFPNKRPVTAPASRWPAEARELARSISRQETLARLTGGLRIVRKSEQYEVRHGELTAKTETLEYVNAKNWYTRSVQDAQHIIQWCDARERGIYSQPFQLGRLRKATAADLQAVPLELDDFSLVGIERSFPNRDATTGPRDKDTMLLTLREVVNSQGETRFLIDNKRHVLLSVEQWQGSKLLTRTLFRDFVEAGGGWWARTIETADGQGHRLALVTQTIHELAENAYDLALQKELDKRASVVFLHFPLPSVQGAKRDLADNKTSFEDRIALMLHFAQSQQWTRSREHLEQAERLAGNKPGLRWLTYQSLNNSRRHEELEKRLVEEAAKLAQSAPGRETLLDQYFLAEHVTNLAVQFFQNWELQGPFDNLKAIYEKQPAHMHALRYWLARRASYLADRIEELKIRKQLAVDNPQDAGLQVSYAQTLLNNGDPKAAYAWLAKALDGGKWLPDEEDTLRSAYAGFLQSQDRHSDLVEYLAAWIKRDPPGASPYEQYLSALIRNDQIGKAETLIAQWLKEGQTPTEPPPAVRARLSAATSHALGQGHNLFTNRIEQQWLAPLAAAAVYFMTHPGRHDSANAILGHYQFRASDEGRGVRKALVRLLTKELDKLTSEQVHRFTDWILMDDSGLHRDDWKRLGEGIRQRWLAEKETFVRHQLGTVLSRLLTQHAKPAEQVAFLHEELHTGPEAFRDQYAQQLFQTLLAQPWSAEYEDEALLLLDQITNAAEPERLRVEIAALYRLVDQMVQGRVTAGMKKIEHQEKLTRTELRQKKAEQLRLARAAAADRLRQAVAKHPGELGRWMEIERLYLETLLDRGPKEVAAVCWEILGNNPAKPASIEDEPDLGAYLARLLRDRAMTTLLNLATRKNADPALIERLLAYCDRGIARDSEDGQWKSLKYTLLIGLDRPKDLEKALEQWVRADDPDNHWRVALGYVLAEQGRIAEAIKLLEEVEKADELRPAAYRALADWYLVTKGRAKQERTLIAAYKTMEEQRLAGLIYNKLQPWQRGDHLPSELDKEVLLVFAALFEKSASPQNYLWYLQQFYQACRDFRLLTGLADAVIGHTAGKAYPFLNGMSSVLAEVRDEATAEAIVEQIGKVRQRAKTAVDQRALDMLEVLVERRAAELKNQPGPHAAKALSALQRAFKRTWSEGEPRLMGDLLAGLGVISDPALSKEQRRQLEVLHREQRPGTYDRLHLGHRLASVIYGQGGAPEAIDLLQTSLKEFADANRGVLPTDANEALTTFVSYLEATGHDARCEQYLQAELRHPCHAQQALWLTQRLDELYHHALQSGATVSLGSGQTLYHGLEKKIQADLANPDPNHRWQLFQLLCSVYRTAHDKKLAGVVEDMKTFAKRMTPLLSQTNNYESMVNSFGQTIHDVGGPREGLAFLLAQIESEPAWYRFNNQDGWARHSWALGQWRQEVGNPGDLTDRLLRLVTKELRRDLESRQERSRALYSRQNNWFWPEQAAAFEKTAEEVLAEHKDSEGSVSHIAAYFYWALGRPGRAIDILFAAHKANLLEEGGQAQLADYLQRENRHAEAIPLLLTLVKDHPEALHYRLSLMSAYFHTGKRPELLALLTQTDAFFHQEDRWQETTLAALAQSCVENQLFSQAVAYCQELIPLHQRTAANRGIGDNTLFNYYSNLALAYSGLHKTPDAVDAAGGAVVSWGQRQDHRAQALDVLRRVLENSADLDAYVALLDKQAAETGRQSALIRKAIGKVYLAKAQYAPAAAQLHLAAILQPNDVETRQALLTCYDHDGNKSAAVHELLDSLQFARRDLKLYRDLGRRYDELQLGHEAERAYTSMVEMLPNDAESHTLLAETRQKQNRWPEAIEHWQRVAELHSLEPIGLLKLAEAQIHERQWDNALQTLQKLQRTWPARFGDVDGQVRQYLQTIERGRPK